MSVDRSRLVRGMYWTAFLLVLFLLYGCGAKQNPPAKFDFAKNAIALNYTADKQLNQNDNQAHSLLIVVYQLSDLNVFNKYAGYRQGLVKLLEAASFDPSVTAFNKYYIEPASSGTLTLNRAEQTKHIGIVAGYYDLNPAGSATFVDVTFDTSRQGWLLTKKTTVNPSKIDLILGKNGLRLATKDNDS